MTRNLKALGHALLAIFAMSALAASTAHALEGQQTGIWKEADGGVQYFHSHKEDTIITAENIGTGMTGAHTFDLIQGSFNSRVECTTVKFAGAKTGAKHESGTKGTTYTAEAVTLTPTYSGCSMGGSKATVDTTTGACQVTFFAATTETVAGHPHGNVEIACAAGKTIDISVEALGVVVHVPGQLITHALSYTNVNTAGGTENEEVTISVTSETNIAWSCTPKARCLSAIGANAGTEASYKGMGTAKGFAYVSSQTKYFYSHKEKTIITADNGSSGHTAKHRFETAPGLIVECSTAKFEGTEVGSKHEGKIKGTTYVTESLTLTPTYAGCTVGGQEAIVDTSTGRCHYKLFAATTETSVNEAHGNMEVTCEAGKTIDISVPGLGIAVHVPGQLIPHAFSYASVNTTGGTEAGEATISMTTPKSIAWTCTPEKQCVSLFGVSTGTAGTYSGLATAKGFVDLNEPAEQGVTGKYQEGAQVGIWKGPEE